MKRYLSLILLTAMLMSCGDQKPANQANTTGETPVTPNAVSAGKLDGKQMNSVKMIHSTFKEVYPISLEESVKNFNRDQNPDKEIKVWTHMADIYKGFTSKHTGEKKLGLRKEAFKLLLLRSALPEEEVLKRAKLKIMEEGMAKQLLSNYKLEVTPLDVGRK